MNPTADEPTDATPEGVLIKRRKFLSKLILKYGPDQVLDPQIEIIDQHLSVIRTNRSNAKNLERHIKEFGSYGSSLTTVSDACCDMTCPCGPNNPHSKVVIEKMTELLNNIIAARMENLPGIIEEAQIGDNAVSVALREVAPSKEQLIVETIVKAPNQMDALCKYMNGEMEIMDESNRPLIYTEKDYYTSPVIKQLLHPLIGVQSSVHLTEGHPESLIPLYHHCPSLMHSMFGPQLFISLRLPHFYDNPNWTNHHEKFWYSGSKHSIQIECDGCPISTKHEIDARYVKAMSNLVLNRDADHVIYKEARTNGEILLSIILPKSIENSAKLFKWHSGGEVSAEKLLSLKAQTCEVTLAQRFKKAVCC